MKKFPAVTIIAPAHNEELLIGSFLDEVGKSSQDLELDYTILVVENGSTDRTAEVVEEKMIKDKHIQLIKVKESGYGLAMIKGLSASETEFAIVFNIDFWESKFLQFMHVDMLGYDVITSSKLLPWSYDHRGFNRRLVTYVYNRFVKIFMHYPGSDTHGIKVMRLSKVMPVIRKCVTTSGIFDSELMVRCHRDGLKILEIPVEVKEIRPARFSMARWLQTPMDIWNLWKVLH